MVMQCLPVAVGRVSSRGRKHCWRPWGKQEILGARSLVHCAALGKLFYLLIAEVSCKQTARSAAHCSVGLGNNHRALNVSSSWLGVGLERAPSGAEAQRGGGSMRTSVLVSALPTHSSSPLLCRTSVSAAQGAQSSSRAQQPSSKGLWPRSSCLWMEIGPCVDPTGNSRVPSHLPRRADVKEPTWSLSQPCSPAPNLKDHITREA